MNAAKGEVAAATPLVGSHGISTPNNVTMNLAKLDGPMATYSTATALLGCHSTTSPNKNLPK